MGLVDRRQEAYDAHPDRWVKVGTIANDEIRKWTIGDDTIANTLKLGGYWKQLPLGKVIIDTVDKLDDLGLDMPVYWQNDSSYTLAWVVKRELLRKGEGGWFERMIAQGKMHYYA
jgi:hypothetical protein